MKTLPFAGAAALALGACTPVPTPLPEIGAQIAPLDPAVSSRSLPADPLAGHSPRAIVEPGDWRQMNNASRGGGMSGMSH